MAEQLHFGDVNAPRPTYGVPVANNQRYGGNRGGYRGVPSQYDYLGGNTRFDFNDAFGYPKQVTWMMTTRLFKRGGAAAGAIAMLVSRCWQTDPKLRRSEGVEDPQEEFVNQTLDRIGFWRAMREADTRALAGQYSAIIFRLRDGRPMNAPVDRLRGGANAIAEVIPVWQADIKEMRIGWDRNDPDTYGKVTMYQFSMRDEKGQQNELLEIHPDRVMILSRDGTMWADPFLEPAFNACIDLEKARGAGGEGLMKDARALVHFDIDAEAKLDDGVGGIAARPPGAGGGEKQPLPKEIAESIGAQMDNINSRFENMVLTKAMSSKMLATKIRGISDAAWVAMNNIAVATHIPVNILFGNQTGERSSQQDEKAFHERCEARRWSELRPRLLDMIDRFSRWGVIDGISSKWRIDWAPLAETDTEKQKMRVETILKANEFFAQMGTVAYTVDEVRRALGDMPLTQEQISEAMKHLDEMPKLPPPPSIQIKGGDSGGGVDGGGKDK